MRVRTKCTIYRKGQMVIADEIIDVDDAQAREWIARGIVEPLDMPEATAETSSVVDPAPAATAPEKIHGKANRRKVTPEDEAAAAALDPDSMVE